MTRLCIYFFMKDKRKCLWKIQPRLFWKEEHILILTKKRRFYLVEVEHCQILTFSKFLIYVIWNPVIDKTDYSWIQLDKKLTPFLIFMGHYLTKFCNKIDSTLLDSTRSSQFGRKRKNVDNGCFHFMIDFIHTLSKIKEVSCSERNDLYSKNYPGSVHFFNIVQETIALDMLMNLARRKKFIQE